MYNIRIKSVPNKAKTGSQLDYSLVDRNTLFLKPNTPVNSDVKNTMGAVPRDEANIEAEGGETVVGDINNDGFLEHQTIVGKRHTQGGVPLNVPEGSFIFSDTKKMMIKDPEVLAMFGMKPSKAGYTPAEIAKKYNINDYIAILKDTAKDNYSKETAQIMLDSNLKKLGMLALVQESIKGFPDGVPAIAESVMGQMMGGQESSEQEQAEGPQAPQEEMQEPPQQKYGGSFQTGGQNGNPYTGKTLYYHNKPYTVGKPDPKKLSSFVPNENAAIYPVSGTYDDGKPVTNYFSIHQLEQILNPKPNSNLNYPHNASAHAWDKMTTAPIKTQRNLMKNIHIETGDILTLGNDKYEIINPWGENSKQYKGDWKSVRDTFDNTQGIIHVKNLANNEDEFLEGEDIKDYYRVDPTLIKIEKNKSTITPTSPNKYDEGVTIGDNDTQTSQGTANNNTTQKVGKDKNGPVHVVKRAIPTYNPTNYQSPIKNQNTFRIASAKDTVFRDGGLTHMQQAGQVQGPGKGSVIYNPDTNTNDEYDASGKLISSVPYAGTSFNVKNKSVLEKAKAAGYDVAYNPSGTKNNYIPEQTQKTGFKVNQKSGFYEAPGYEIGEKGFDNFYKFWNPELQGYKSATGTGPEAWKTDFLKAKGAESEASRYLGDIANQQGIAAGFGPQLDVNQKNKQGKGVAYIPGNQYYNLKKFNKTPVPVVSAPQTPEVPARKEDAINVQQINGSPITNRNGWSKNATLNFANSFLADRYHGQAVLPKYNAETPDYSLLNPAQAIAQIQSSVNSMNNQAANTMSGNVAFGAGFGLTGQGIDKAAGIQADYDNKNVGIVNRANEMSADIANRTNQLNQNAKYQYNNDIQTLGQQEVNTNNAYRANVIKSMIGANQEDEKTRALQIMFPQVGIDHWNHDIGWSGVGRNPFGYDNYINSAGSGIGTGKGSNSIAPDYAAIHTMANKEYANAYKEALTTMGEEDARAYARQVASNVLKERTNSKAPGYGTNTAANVYAAMFGQNE